MTHIKFSTDTFKKVMNNHLTWNNIEEFDNCKSQADYCITFVRVSNMTNSETMLADEIAKEYLNQILAQKPLCTQSDLKNIQ